MRTLCWAKKGDTLSWGSESKITPNPSITAHHVGDGLPSPRCTKPTRVGQALPLHHLGHPGGAQGRMAMRPYNAGPSLSTDWGQPSPLDIDQKILHIRTVWSCLVKDCTLLFKPEARTAENKA